MRDDASLGDRLEALDGRPFGAYRTLRGAHAVGEFFLHLDHVPGDPAAGPARARLRLPLATAGIDPRFADDPVARLAAEDFFARGAARAAETLLAPEGHAAPGSGRIVVERPSGPIVDRTAFRLVDGFAELRLALDLPAWERTVRGRHARSLLTEVLLRFARGALLLGPSRRAELEAHARSVAEHLAIREALRARGLVAFVPDGTRLPGCREPIVAGSDRAVVFEVAGRSVRGLGIPGGVTLLVGGRGSGAPELVRALAWAGDPLPPGEPAHGLVAVRRAAFVPAGAGAEEQRARLQRAVDAGARLAVVDEDASAPAFLARDPRLAALQERRPAAWTFSGVARDLDRTLGVASIVAAESTGELLAAADVVLVARDGRFEDAGSAIVPPSPAKDDRFPTRPASTVRIERSPSEGGRRAELGGAGSLRVGGVRVVIPDLGAPLDDASRRGLAFALARAGELAADPIAVSALLDLLEAELDSGALERWGELRGDLARPSRIAIAETLQRLSSARFELE